MFSDCLTGICLKHTNARFCSQFAIDLPIGPVNSRVPAVTPSRYSNRCLSGNSFACNWQTNHCNNLTNSNSNNLTMPPILPVLTLVPSHPIATIAFVSTSLKNIRYPKAYLNQDCSYCNNQIYCQKCL